MFRHYSELLLFDKYRRTLLKDRNKNKGDRCGQNASYSNFGIG